MKYRNRSDYSGYEPHEREFPKVEPKYAVEFDKETGQKKVIKVGDTNVYMQKQEALQDTLIYNLIDQYQRTGDASIFGETVDGFIDAVALPKSLMEAENLRVKAGQLFDALPRETRSEYGNDVGTFLKNVDIKLKAKAQELALAERQKVTQQEEPKNE